MDVKQPGSPQRQAIPILGQPEGLEGLLRTHAFRLLLKSGSPVKVEKLSKVASVEKVAVVTALSGLDRAGRIRRDGSGRVVASAGLSVVPSNHEIEIGGRRYWTWCAYDAVGILGSLGSGGRVITQSPETGDRLEVEFARAAPLRRDLVLLMADSACCESTVEDWCPQVNLFENEELARQWMTTKGVEGEIITITEATRRGINEWSPLLDDQNGKVGRHRGGLDQLPPDPDRPWG